MGNTGRNHRFLAVLEDHPHIHGEYSWICCVMSSSEGSPPHTWGIHIMNDFEKAQSGITPTYMGNTLALAGVTVWLEDHPHIHGEYLPFALNVYRLPGSPPHTWGILFITNRIEL